MTREEAAAILTESKRQNEVMANNPQTFFAPKDLASGTQNAYKRIAALEMALSALAVEPQKEQNDRRAEFDYMLAFASENRFDSETCCDQLRCLWTAYCLHHDLDPDTAQYDNDLMALWTEIEETESNHIFWKSYEIFDNVMCYFLV